MKTVKIKRAPKEMFPNATLGICQIFDESGKMIFQKYSLEREWLDNASNVSCVPVGEYPLVLERSPRFGKDLYELKEVPKRAECKFHAANYWHQLNGCIALGDNINNFEEKGYGVTNSRKSMEDFHNALNGDKNAKLIIE